MISFKLETKPSPRAHEDMNRSLEVDASRRSVRVAANLRLPRLWCVMFEIRRIKPEWAEQEKAGLHVTPVDGDGWNTIYYRRPGGHTYGLLVIGRNKTWFESAIDRAEGASA